MAHVIQAEGISYLSAWGRPDWISKEEWAELIAVDESIVDV